MNLSLHLLVVDGVMLRKLSKKSLTCKLKKKKLVSKNLRNKRRIRVRKSRTSNKIQQNKKSKRVNKNNSKIQFRVRADNINNTRTKKQRIIKNLMLPKPQKPKCLNLMVKQKLLK